MKHHVSLLVEEAPGTLCRISRTLEKHSIKIEQMKTLGEKIDFVISSEKDVDIEKIKTHLDKIINIVKINSIN